MGTRVKTFDSTGIATNGRLYAGDLNAIQDKYADQSNYAQQVDVATVSVGESALKLLRYGAGEARISGHMRIDGIFRGLGGLYAGAFTTAQRDAIALNSRPYGLVILNTTTNRLEWNQGTDPTPNWQPISDVTGDVLVGTTIDWPWIHTSLPANYLLAYGQAISRTTYPVLAALAAASAYPHGNGDGSTTFNLPDLRGRVGVGKDDMGGTAASRITAGGSGVNGATLGSSGGVQNYGLVTGEMPAHTHTLVAATVTGLPALAGTVSNGSLTLSGVISHSLGVNRTADVAVGNPAHGHGGSFWRQGGGSVSYSSNEGGDGWQSVDGNAQGTFVSQQPSFGITGGVNNGSLAIGGAISNGSLNATLGTLDVGGSTDSSGSGTAHQNVQPSIVVNKAMRVA